MLLLVLCLLMYSPPVRGLIKGWALGKLSGCDDVFDHCKEHFAYKELHFITLWPPVKIYYRGTLLMEPLMECLFSFFTTSKSLVPYNEFDILKYQYGTIPCKIMRVSFHTVFPCSTNEEDKETLADNERFLNISIKSQADLEVNG